MEEDDGFQPLFDYSKIYDSPPKLQEDDSDEEEIVISTKQRCGATKRCASNMLTKITRIEKLTVKEVPNSEASNDDDWLTSPPKLAKVAGSPLLSGHATLQQLRQKRAELILLETQASGAVACVDESRRLEAQIRHQQASTAPKKTESLSHVEKVADPHVGKEKIVLRVQDKSGSICPLRIYLADKFERLFTAYSKHVGVSSSDQFMFQFDGDQLSPNSTPKELGMEDDDIIEVYDRV